MTATAGRTYTLETRPNVLYRLAAQSSGDPWEQVYRIIIVKGGGKSYERSRIQRTPQAATSRAFST